MNSLIHLFHVIVTYPILNLLIWLYLRVNNFALALIILTCVNTVCFSWSARYLSARGQMIRNALKQTLQPMVQDIQRRYAEDPVALRYALASLSKEHVPGALYRLFYLRIPQLFSLVGLYISCGTWVALVVLGGSSLSELNEVLYPFQAHLTTLPDYSFAFLGQTASLVKPGILPTLLIAIVPVLLVHNFILKKPPKLLQFSICGFSQRIMLGTRWGCALLNGVLVSLRLVGFVLLLAWLFAAGTLLTNITYEVLCVVLELFLVFLRRTSILQKGQ